MFTSFSSSFCRKREALYSFEQTIKNINSKWIFVSYNNEGIVDKDTLYEEFSKYGKVTIYEVEYKRFKSKKNDPENKTIEYVFAIQKEQNE